MPNSKKLKMISFTYRMFNFFQKLYNIFNLFPNALKI